MPVERLCLVCQRLFTVKLKPHRILKGEGKYCSARCYYQRALPVSRLCLACQRPFTAPQNCIQTGGGKYCSQQCYHQHKRDSTQIATRFWTKVLKTEECWLWQGKRHSNGYGTFGIGATRQFPAHRIAYELTYGMILPGLFCLHHCDNRLCVRPEHLFLGTQWDNIHDMISKGRHIAMTHPGYAVRGDKHPRRLHPERYARGEQGGNAKLTAVQVREIRRLAADEGWGYKRLANAFGLQPSTMAAIVRRKTWAHLND